MFSRFQRKIGKASESSRGFTLVELMVTVGIFVFMTAAIMARYNSFYSGTLFTNLAYDIAMTIRQAQTYGISVKVNDQTTNNFSASYGVHFSNDAAGDKDKKFMLFIEDSTQGYQDTDSLENTYNLKQGARITAFCASNSVADCIPSTDTHSLDIIFQRPNPDAKICYNADCTWKYATIRITAGDGTVTRDVKVNAGGQISVN